MSPTLRRYVVLQVPGVIVAAVVAALLWSGAVISGTVAITAFVAWLAKDVALYPFTKTAYETTVPSGADKLVGEAGMAATRFEPSGRIRIHGELWNARLEGGECLESGARVVVVGREGSTLIVRPPKDAAERRE